MKTLVVVYSRTGATRTLGESIAASVGGDFDLVISRAPRQGPVGFFLSSWEATFGLLTEIAHPARKVDDYDLVVVGSPTWNASLSSPVRTYLHQNREHFRSVAFFVTSGGHGARRALGQMREVAGQSPLATLALDEHEVGTPHAAHVVRSFAQRLAVAFEANVAA